MPQPNNSRKKVYDAMSKKYDMGSYEEFNSKMDNSDSRKKVYDAMSKSYDMGSYEEFESKIAPVKKKADSGFTSLSQKSDSEGQTGSLAGAENQNNANGFPEIQSNNPLDQFIPTQNNTVDNNTSEEQPRPETKQTDTQNIDPVSGMKIFDGFSDADLKNMKGENKEPLPVNPLIKNKIKESKLKDELSNVKVTPENMDAVSAKTDELSALQKQDDQIIENKRSNKVKQIENDFYTATKNNDDDAIAEQRLQDAVNISGVWNNIKNISKNAYNTTIDGLNNMLNSKFSAEFNSIKADTDPLADQKKQVINEALQNKQNLTQEEINQKAGELFKAKEKENLFIDRANSFLDDLPQDDKELLKQDRALKAEHLGDDNMKRLKVISAMRTVADNKISEYKDIENQLVKLKDNKQELPPELYAKYQDLGNQIKNIGSELQKNEDYILKNNKDLGTAQQEFDLFKREYGDIYNFFRNISAGTAEMGLGLLGAVNYIGSLSPDPLIKANALQSHKAISDLTKDVQEYRDESRKPVQSIESLEGFINYTSDLIANQLPILGSFALGEGGLAVIGASSLGQKHTDITNEVLQGKGDYNAMQMALVPLLYGGAEVVSELPTLSILRKGGRVFEAMAKGESELIKKTAIQKAKYWAKDFGIDMGKEQSGEHFTNFVQNFNDKYILGKKDVGLLDNTGQVFKDTFALTSILKVAPHIAGVIVKPFQSNSNLGTIDENSRKIIEFTKQLESEGLTDTEKTVINKQIDKLVSENSKIMVKTVDNIKDMPTEIYDELVSLFDKAGDIKTQAREIADGNLPNKKDLLSSLDEEYKALQEKRLSIIEGKTSTVEVLPLQQQETLKKQALSELIKELNPEGKEDIEITNKQILDRANQIYSESKKNKIDNTKESTNKEITNEEKPTQKKPNEVVNPPIDKKPTQTANTPVEEDKSITDPSEDVATITEDLSNPESVAPVTEVSPEAKGRGAKTTVKTQGKGKKITEPVTEATPETETKEELNNPVTEITPIAETTPESEAKEGTAPVVEPKTKSKSKSKKGLTNTENKTETTKETTPVAEELNSLENKNKPQKEATAKTTKTDKQVSETDKQAEKPTADESAQPQAKLTKAEKAKLAKEERRAKAQAIKDKHTGRATEATDQPRLETKKTGKNKETTAEKTFKDKFKEPTKSPNEEISEEEAYAKHSQVYEKQRRELENEKPAKELIRDFYRGLIRRFTDRQYLSKSLVAKSGMARVKNLMINQQGASGRAKVLYEEAYNKIYKGLTGKDRRILDDIIQDMRIIEIDQDREARGLKPVKHPGGIDMHSAKKTLSEREKEIGTEKNEDLRKRADNYFQTFRDILKEMYENGLISEESYDSMKHLNYQPRIFLKHITDFNGDVKDTKNKNAGSGLASEQIKGLKGGDDSSLISNSEYLLSLALNARARAIAMNKINTKFITQEFPKALERFNQLDPKNLKGEDKIFYNAFKELSSKVIENPIKGQTKDGNLKYKYSKTPDGFQKNYYYVNGVQHSFFLEENLHNSWNDKIDGFIKPNAKEIVSYLSGSALIKTAATGRNPAFAINNTPTDLMFNVVFSKEYSNFVPKATFQVAGDALKGIKALRTGSETLKKYIEYGGMMDFMSTQGRLKKSSMLAKFFEKTLKINIGKKQFRINRGPKTRDITRSLFNKFTLAKISEYSEMMFRLGLFQRSIKNQLKELGLKDISEVADKEQIDDIYNQAVATSRSMIDFNQGGSITKDIEALIPYTNVAFQGLRVTSKAFQERPVATTARVLQASTLMTVTPIGISLALLSAYKPDDEKRSATEIYLDAKKGIDPYTKSKYMLIVLPVKDENGEYIVLKIAKAKDISPFTSITDDIAENMLRGIAGQEKISAEKMIDNSFFAFNTHVNPIDPADMLTRIPTVKARATYKSGYDYLKKQPLSRDIDKVPERAEGLTSKNVHDFYKKLSDYGLSPIRCQGAVESLITSPRTNPFVGGFYGVLDAVTSRDKDFKEIGKGLLESATKSVTGRLISHPNDFVRGMEKQKELKEIKDRIGTEKIKINSNLNQTIDKFANKEITQKELVEEIKKIYPKREDVKNVVNKAIIRTQLKKYPWEFTNIKYERDNDVKAEMIKLYYGNINDGSPKSNEIKNDLFKSRVLTTGVYIKYKRLLKEDK